MHIGSETSHTDREMWHSTVAVLGSEREIKRVERMVEVRTIEEDPPSK